MPGLFRDVGDPDEKRREILWMAVGFIIILTVWLGVVLFFGFRPFSMGVTYDEAVMSVGLGILILCSILYLVGREREQRTVNRRLIRELHTTVTMLDQRVQQFSGLCTTSTEPLRLPRPRSHRDLRGGFPGGHDGRGHGDVGALRRGVGAPGVPPQFTEAIRRARKRWRRTRRWLGRGPCSTGLHVHEVDRQVRAWNAGGRLCAARCV